MEPIYTVDNPPPMLDWPYIYAMRCDGVCMEPVIPNGACCIFDKSADVRAGDLVGIWAEQRNGRIKSFVKRLSLGLPDFVRFPVKLREDENVMPVVMFEQLNPPARYTVEGNRVYGVHRCLGFTMRDEGVPIGTVLNIVEETIQWFDRPRPARKPRVRRTAA